MVAGHLQIKNDVYYMVLSYTDEQTGKRKEKWISTGLHAKGNKTRAEKMLSDARKTFEPPKSQSNDLSSDMKFSDYLLLWLEIIRPTVEKTSISLPVFRLTEKERLLRKTGQKQNQAFAPYRLFRGLNPRSEN